MKREGSGVASFTCRNEVRRFLLRRLAPQFDFLLSPSTAQLITSCFQPVTTTTWTIIYFQLPYSSITTTRLNHSSTPSFSTFVSLGVYFPFHPGCGVWMLHSSSSCTPTSCSFSPSHALPSHRKLSTSFICKLLTRFRFRQVVDRGRKPISSGRQSRLYLHSKLKRMKN